MDRYRLERLHALLKYIPKSQEELSDLFSKRDDWVINLLSDIKRYEETIKGLDKSTSLILGYSETVNLNTTFTCQIQEDRFTKERYIYIEQRRCTSSGVREKEPLNIFRIPEDIVEDLRNLDNYYMIKYI